MIRLTPETLCSLDATLQECHLPSIECGVGWWELVGASLKELNRLKVPVLSVRERFGILRIYVGSSEDECKMAEALAYLRNISEKSESICENCGTSPAFLYSVKDYLETRCEHCYRLETIG